MHKPVRKNLMLASALSCLSGLLVVVCAGLSFDASADGQERRAPAAAPARSEGRDESRAEPPKLYRVWRDGRTGFIDNKGRPVVPLRRLPFEVWDDVTTDGMARIYVSTQERPGYCCRFGYMNSAGRVVVRPRLWEAKSFSEGLAAALIDGRWGYIDREGRTALGPKWIAADSFSEGLAAVYDEEAGHVFIDHSGRTVFKLEGVTAPGGFHDGMAQVMVASKDGAGHGYFNRDGRFEFGYIDREGRLAVPGPFEKAEDFSEGLAAVTVGGRVGFIDREGRFAVEPAYDSARGFKGGTAVVGLGGKYWFIDGTGKKVGDCPALSCDFSEGLAPAEIRGKWGFIDRTGRVVIEPRFDDAGKFDGGLARVTVGWIHADVPQTRLRTGYIDRTGRYVWGPFR